MLDQVLVLVLSVLCCAAAFLAWKYRNQAILHDKAALELGRRLTQYRTEAPPEQQALIASLQKQVERYYAQQLEAEKRAQAEANNAHAIQQVMSQEIRRLLRQAQAKGVDLSPSAHIESALIEHEQETGRDASLGGWAGPA